MLHFKIHAGLVFENFTDGGFVRIFVFTCCGVEIGEGDLLFFLLAFAAGAGALSAASLPPPQAARSDTIITTVRQLTQNFLFMLLTYPFRSR